MGFNVNLTYGLKPQVGGIRIVTAYSDPFSKLRGCHAHSHFDLPCSLKQAIEGEKKDGEGYMKLHTIGPNGARVIVRDNNKTQLGF